VSEGTGPCLGFQGRAKEGPRKGQGKPKTSLKGHKKAFTMPFEGSLNGPHVIHRYLLFQDLLINKLERCIIGPLVTSQYKAISPVEAGQDK
jgi:hypothetical protein